MATLEENRSLMQRIFNLPANDAELRQIGFGDDEITVKTAGGGELTII